MCYLVLGGNLLAQTNQQGNFQIVVSSVKTKQPDPGEGLEIACKLKHS